MKNILFLLTVLTVIMLTSACAPKTGVIQTDKNAYLWFTGNTESTVVVLNDGEMLFNLKRAPVKSSDTPSSHDNLYKLHKPGKYNIKVMRGSNIAVNRTMLIGEGMIKEIMVP